MLRTASAFWGLFWKAAPKPPKNFEAPSAFFSPSPTANHKKIMRLVLCYPVSQKHIDQIQQTVPEWEVVDAGQEGVAKELFDADFFCGHAKVPVDWEGVVKQGRLQWVQSSAAGMDHCLTPAVIDSEIIVTSASGVLSDQVTEHAIALITGWTRSMPRFYTAHEKREFIRLPTTDLTRKTVGIVGFGGVGRRLARVLAAFDCRILATDLFPENQPAYVDQLLPETELHTMLPQCDVVILCAPLNASTYQMIGKEELAAMQTTALLANMARGSLVDTDALVAALNDGVIAGTVMDVTDPEPLPPEHPLWETPQTIITPHVAGQSGWRIDRMTEMYCQNLVRWQQGKKLINQLDEKALGFPKRDGKTPLWIEE